jgi:undecaprenyl-diphosphatase
VTTLQALFLGILQGATEFLPISSSGHLVLVPWLLNWPAPSLAFDAVTHWGTAAAVVAYFWHDWISLVVAAIQSLPSIWRYTASILTRNQPRTDEDDPASHPLNGPLPGSAIARDARLAWLIILGTVPAALIGYLLEDFFEEMFARPVAAACLLFVTATLLAASEYVGRRERDLDTLRWPDALLIGLGQALAIFPGISRSGATIAAGLSRGLKREPAARFSFLLATPIIIGAGLLKVADLAQAGGLASQAPALIVGFVAAGAVGLACIHFLLRYLQRRQLYPFAIYCVVVGFVCLVTVLARGR